MGMKALRTIDYAREFHRRLREDKWRKYVIGVDAKSHLPTMVPYGGKFSEAWFAEKLATLVGVYRGTEDLLPEDIADAIDAVDDFVPRAYRDESRAAL